MHSRLTHLATLVASLGALGSIDPARFHPAQFAPGIMNADVRLQVMNAYTVGNPANLTAMGFTVDVFEQISTRAYDVKYPEILWNKIMPRAGIDTSVSPGAKTVSHKVRDWRGKGAFRTAIGKDIPMVGQSINKITVPLEAGGIGASADLDDIRAVAFGFEGINLLTDHGAAMRKGYERHVEEVFFFGYSALGFDGWINTPNVPATNAGAKAAGGTTWAVATALEIIKDVTDAVKFIVSDTKGVFRPNRISLPIDQYLLIATMPSGSLLNETVLTYLQRTLTAITGGAFTFEQVRYLDGAGAGATDRMVVESVTDETHYMPMSVPFNMLPPQDRQYATDLYADYKFGGFLRPWPRSARYVDGI